MGLLDLGQALAQFDALKRRVGLLASNPAQFAAGSSGPELGNAGPYPGGLLSVMPQVREQAINEALKLTPGLLGATVYHGSPYQFEKFDASKIGTGQGAQAYGYGHYLADRPETAKNYVLQDSVLRLRDATGKLLKEWPQPVPIDERLYYVDASTWLKEYGNSAAAIAAHPHMHPIAKAVMPGLERSGQRWAFEDTPGYLYRVDLPDEAIAKMLDWDKPLSQQSDAVKAAANALNKQHFPWLTEGQNLKMTGEDLYFMPGFVKHTDTAKAWADLGIPGIKYLDQGSRGMGRTGRWLLKYANGRSEVFDFLPNAEVLKQMGATAEPYGRTYNYVVFPGNEGLLKILGRE